MIKLTTLKRQLFKKKVLLSILFIWIMYAIFKVNNVALAHND